MKSSAPPSPQRHAGILAVLNQHTVVLRHLLGQVRQQGVLAAAQATLVAGGAGKGQVGELGVDGHADHLGVDGLELVHAVAEGHDLCGCGKVWTRCGRSVETFGRGCACV